MSDLALVTGAAGFVGSAVVRELLASGRRVRVFVRRSSDPGRLRGLPIEVATGDLRRAADCRDAVAGCAEVYHVAAHYALWVAEPRAMRAANVDGTAHVLDAAAAAGARRVVYTSTVGAVGLPGDGRPGDETTPLRRAQLVGHYKRTKFLAERVALDRARRGQPVVVVNPSAPMGEGDTKPTPTGQLIVDFLNGQMPAYLDTGLNVVDVADVARGHRLAAERGRVGERYILGNENLTLCEILQLLAGISGLPAPRVQIPYAVALGVGGLSELVATAFRQPPAVPLTGVRMARKRMFFDASKARRELGLTSTPVRLTLARAVAWFAAHGHVKSAALAGRLVQRAAAVIDEHRR